MKTRRDPSHAAVERGSTVVPFVIALPVVIGFMGMAIDLSYIYTRKCEMQQIADSMALTAARELNGTKAGVTSAMNKLLFSSNFHNYNLGSSSIGWNPAALSLSDNPASGTWKDASSISNDAQAAGLVYARIDTSKLIGSGDDLGTVTTSFITVLTSEQSLSGLSASAVAGPASVQVTPLAICALDTNSSGVRNNPGIADEKLEYGFRTGVSYNLLDLSPVTTTPLNYLVNPLDPVDGANSSNPAHFTAGHVQPFFCTGTVALPTIQNGTQVYVQSLNGSSLPIAGWLNSRFDTGSGGCNATTAPPDWNVREFIGGYSNWWMPSPTFPAAPYPPTSAGVDRTSPSSRVTAADLKFPENTTATITVGSWGPLWAYSRPTPASGAAYTLDSWPDLYKHAGPPTLNEPVGDKVKYGGTFPYLSLSHRLAPAGAAGVRNRRVLNIPLLDCSAGLPGSTAKVLGIGKFFMTSRATASPPVIAGEFAGALPTGSPVLSVALNK
jgi:Flp pilus assembly protein TadG